MIEKNKNFSSLGLSKDILKAIDVKGYDTPSPIQFKAIPEILKGKDVLAAAQTGTGKTAGFTLPLLNNLNNGKTTPPRQVRALILTPTRELAAQVEKSVMTYGKYLSLKTAVVFGGVGIKPQINKLRSGVDILVATPGRLLDLNNKSAIRFNQLEVLILDEADRMLDMGFINDIRKILTYLPSKRQNLMFSATFSDDILDLAKGITKNPTKISVSPKNSTVNLVTQKIYHVDQNQKTALLIRMIKENKWVQTLVFTRTKHGADKVARLLNKKKIKSSAIHGNKSQGSRTRALEGFKNKEICVLVATDIAARGLDIEQLPHVINHELPFVAIDYIHRIGRTGRAGSFGEAISLVCTEEFEQLRDIENLINKIFEKEIAVGFEPTRGGSGSPQNKRPQRRMSRGNKWGKDSKKTTEKDQTKKSDRKKEFVDDEAQVKPKRRRNKPGEPNAWGKIKRKKRFRGKSKSNANGQKSVRKKS